MSPEPVTDFAQDCYLAYPTANGFRAASLIVGQRQPGALSLVEIPLSSGSPRTLATLPHTASEVPYFDVAGPRIAVVLSGALWIVESGGPPRAVFTTGQPTPGPALSRDGSRALLTVSAGDGQFQLLELDLASAETRLLCHANWWMNHAHYCPHDESWVGFCHEGPCEQVPDRVWGWHAEAAPAGRCLFDQSTPAGLLAVGHERWCFHDRSAYAVAYGVSEGEPRGIYEIFAEGRAPRLVSQGDRDWHVDISRCGRWAVADTTGPADALGRRTNLAEAGGISDIILIDPVTGRREFLARTTNAVHPSHPHPVFSPDGAWIYFNECDPSGHRNRILRIRNPRFPDA